MVEIEPWKWFINVIIYAPLGAAFAFLTYKHYRYVWQDLKSKKESEKNHGTFKIISTLYLIYLFTQLINAIIGYSTYFLTATCAWRTIIGLITLPFVSSSKYWIYMFRLRVFTQEEMCSYPVCFKRFVNISPYIIAVETIFIIFLFWYHFADSELASSGHVSNGHRYMKICILPSFPVYIPIFVLLDGYFWTFITAVGFVYPLRRLIKDLLRTASDKQSLVQIQSFIDITTKYTVLTWIPAIMNVFDFVLLILFQGAGLMEQWGFLYSLSYAIRNFIEMICILLMTPYYNEPGLCSVKGCGFMNYKSLCCGAIVCVNQCYGYSRNEQSIKLAELQIANTSACVHQTNQSEIEV